VFIYSVAFGLQMQLQQMHAFNVVAVPESNLELHSIAAVLDCARDLTLLVLLPILLSVDILQSINFCLFGLCAENHARAYPRDLGQVSGGSILEDELSDEFG
jgi:hypothetical protein